MKEQELPHGQSIIGFDSAEEMHEYLAKGEADAIAGALPEQWEIGWGAYVVRMVADLAIWGHIFSQEEFLEANIKGLPEHDEEIRAELEDLKDAHGRGYRYGKWYSEVEPTGEYGSAHVVSLWEISKEDFAVAMSNGWQMWPEMSLRVYENVSAALARRESDGPSRPEGTR